jgi:hypothetical protein
VAEADVVAGAAIPDDGRPPIFGGKLVKFFDTFISSSMTPWQKSVWGTISCFTRAGSKLNCEY